MTKQETYLLNLIRKTRVGYVKIFRFEQIFNKIMEIKQTENPADVDTIGLINALEGLVKAGKLAKTTQHVTINMWGDTKEEPAYIWTKITDAA